jgi:hypothetical protein
MFVPLRFVLFDSCFDEHSYQRNGEFLVERELDCRFARLILSQFSDTASPKLSLVRYYDLTRQTPHRYFFCLEDLKTGIFERFLDKDRAAIHIAGKIVVQPFV